MTGESTTLIARGPAADAIELMRKRRGIRQRPLSLRAGLSKSYVNKLELGLQPSLLAFARLAATLRLTPLEVWTVLMAEAHAASQGCPRCAGRGEVQLPYRDDLVDYACPLCRPWPDGFPGEQHGDHWVIPPYAQGETPTFNGWETAQ